MAAVCCGSQRQCIIRSTLQAATTHHRRCGRLSSIGDRETALSNQPGVSGLFCVCLFSSLPSNQAGYLCDLKTKLQSETSVCLQPFGPLHKRSLLSPAISKYI